MLVYVGYSAVVGLLVLVTYGILQWLGIPAGNLLDWLIGIASFWWLIAITTLPWNLYFEARSGLAEAQASQKRAIAVESEQVNYLRQVARGSLIVAILLHLLSALGLYGLAAAGISAVGYGSAGATLLLTGLRPAIRTYGYLAERLGAIREQLKYPREDVLELRQRLAAAEATLKDLGDRLDLENSHSWASQQQQEWQELRQTLAHLRAIQEQARADNELAHQRLSQEAQSAIAQLSEDSRFLGHVREIIRFVKNA